MNTFISRKRHWELAADSQSTTDLRDAMLGAMALVILAVLVAVWLT